MRSASPPTGTTERAGIAETSPAGEKDGREAVPGPAQDGETSTVHQSREWPFRDTAPRQDPAESRVDPIWGADPPDAVRWHVDMTPDQAPASRSPTAPAPPQQSANDAERTATQLGTAAAAEQGGAQFSATAAGKPGDTDLVEAEATAASTGETSAAGIAPVEAWPGTGSGGSDAARADPAPGVGMASEGSVVGDPQDPGAGVGWFSPGVDGGQYTGPLSERLSAERPGDGPISPPAAEAEPGSDVPGDAGPAAAATSDPGTDTSSSAGQAASFDATLGGALPTDPGGVPSGMASPSTGLPLVPQDFRSPELIESGMVYVDPDPEIGSPPHAMGWAEQPVARLGPEGDPGGPSDASPEAGGQDSMDGEISATGAGDTEAGVSGRPDAPAAAAGIAGSEEIAGAERISGAEVAGVGPGVERASESATDAASAFGMVTEPEGVSPAAGPPTAGGRADGSDTPDVRDRTDGEELGGHARDLPRGDAPRSDVLGARGSAAAREATGSGDAGEVLPASAPDKAPWNEPALPMAWPPGMTPPDRERRGSPHEDADDGDLVPEPDPTWPKLFGQSSEPRAADGPAEAPGGVHATASVDQVGGERGTDEPPNLPAIQHDGTGYAAQAHDLSSGQRQKVGDPAGSPDALRLSTAPASGQPSDGVTPPDQQPAVIDISSQEPSEVPGSGESPEPGHVRSEDFESQPVVRADTGNEGGTDTSGHGNISTVMQRAKTEEGEVGLRETPVDLRSSDVSRETSAGGGGGMDSGLENEGLEDEAAVAVREAVSRAAAEAGADVSRETGPRASDFTIDELGEGPSVDRESAARNARVTFRIDRDALNGDRRVVAVANQKGGVGKSTTAVNIGAYLALAGARVLVVDLDPQGNASTGLGLDHREIEPSIYDVLNGEASPVAAIRPTGVANLHVLPSTIDLAGAEVELVSAMSRETRLRRALESIDHQYDSILIDCPPSLGLLTVNALAAADELLIPIQCEYYALEGLGQLLRNVELVRANLNPDLRIGGIVLTMYDGRTRLALQVVDEVRKHFTDIVYQTVVPRSVRLSEAPGYGLPIALYDPLSRGGIAYRDLTFELAERSGLLAPTGEGAS